jgi:heme/copper-type cytochrome/quinol oxidase subunit 2
MTLSALILMVTVQGLVTLITVYFMYKVLFSDKKGENAN